jgi:hypothetical protein
MKKNKNTELTRFLVKMGIDQRNAYRIINESAGQAARILQTILPEYLTLKKASEAKDKT